MEMVVPWSKLVVLIEPQYPKGGRGRPPSGGERMLRIFSGVLVQPAEPAVEDALYNPVTRRGFVGIDPGREPAPGETTSCNFSHLLEQRG
jgi:IS5 family transposase